MASEPIARVDASKRRIASSGFLGWGRALLHCAKDSPRARQQRAGRVARWRDAPQWNATRAHRPRCALARGPCPNEWLLPVLHLELVHVHIQVVVHADTRLAVADEVMHLRLGKGLD